MNGFKRTRGEKVEIMGTVSLLRNRMMAEKENGTMKGFFSFWLKLGEKCVDENDPIIKEELLEEYIKREKRWTLAHRWRE